MVKAPVQTLKSLSSSEKIKSYFKLFLMLPDEIPNVKIAISLSLTRQLFNEGIRCLEVKDFKSTMKMMPDGQQPLETARFILKNFKSLISTDQENLWGEIKDLKDSITTTEIQAKSLQSLQEAKKLYESSIQDNENAEEVDIFRLY